MRTKVVKWGNSLGLRIPKAFAEEISVADGTEVELNLEDGQLVIKVAARDELNLDDLLDGVTDANLHGETDTGDAVGSEHW